MVLCRIFAITEFIYILRISSCKCIVLLILVILLSGSYCEEDIDECRLNVCKHGHCLNSDGEYDFFEVNVIGVFFSVVMKERCTFMREKPVCGNMYGRILEFF